MIKGLEYNTYKNTLPHLMLFILVNKMETCGISLNKVDERIFLLRVTNLQIATGDLLRL